MSWAKRQEPLAVLGLGKRIEDVLEAGGMHTVADVEAKLAEGDEAFLALPKVGEKTLEAVRASLAQHQGETAAAEPEPMTEPPLNLALADMLAAEQGTERRTSFVVRLTVDEAGRPRRGEIEHTHTHEKRAFKAANGQRLVEIMEEMIGVSAAAPEAMPAAAEAKQPMPQRAAILAIQNVQIQQGERLGGMNLAVRPNTEFRLVTNFVLEGEEAQAQSNTEAPFDLVIFAHRMDGSSAQQVASHRGRLVAGQTEYTQLLQCEGLAHGRYRLITFMTLLTPLNLASWHDTTFVKVEEISLPARPQAGPAVARPR